MLREQQYKRQLDQNEINSNRLNEILKEKTIEIEYLKRQQLEFSKKHKNESVCQMEKLIAKENIINVNKTIIKVEYKSNFKFILFYFNTEFRKQLK